MAVDNEYFPQRKILGMSKRQAIFLLVMGAVDCLVLCIGSIVLLNLLPTADREQLLNAMPFPLVSVTEIPTSTPIPTDLPTATKSPTDTPTPQPASTPIPGWREFSGKTVSIWLPDTYIGGDPSADRVRMQYDLDAANFSISLLSSYFNAKPAYSFFAIGDIVSIDDYAIVLIVEDEAAESGTLDAYINQLLGKDATKNFYFDRTDIRLDWYEAVRFTVESKEDRTRREYRYLLIDETGRHWQLSFSTLMRFFDQRSSGFDLSAKSFRAVR